MQAVTHDGRSPRRIVEEVRSPAVHTQDLVDALKAMGLDAIDPHDVTLEFRDVLVRLASSWNVAISGSTLTTRRCDLRRFARWCHTQGNPPFTSDDVLADLMARHLAEVGQTFAPGTTKRIGSNLTALAKGVGSEPAVRDAQEYRCQATRAAYKLARSRSVIRQKPHLTVPQMQAIRASIEASDALPLRQLRNLAIFDTMCDLLARRSEVIGMCVRDIDLAAGTVKISYSKTDQTGRGTIFHVSPRTVTSIDAWLNASGILDNPHLGAGTLPVFVAVMNDGKLRRGPNGLPAPMDGKSVARILQHHAEPLGISGVAGHSLRCSMARALHEAGVPEEEITKKGRWSSLDQMREYVGLTAPIQGASDVVF